MPASLHTKLFPILDTHCTVRCCIDTEYTNTDKREIVKRVVTNATLRALSRQRMARDCREEAARRSERGPPSLAGSI